MKYAALHSYLLTAWRTTCSLRRAVSLRCLPHACMVLCACTMMYGCIREPELHLPGSVSPEITIPVVDLDLEAYWNYELEYGVVYDWRAEWYYGWDHEDSLVFGPIGYTEPNVFHLRRYFTQGIPYAPHSSVIANTVEGTTFRGSYNWGFWDILVWSDINPINDEAQSLNIDETSSLDSIIAYTNPSMKSARYQAPAFTRAFYQPEQLFSAYQQAVEINKDLEGFVYDSLRNVYVKQLDMKLHPITYIYLTQIILHHNNNKIINADGSANFSAMARSSNVNTGYASPVPISVNYNVRFKHNCPMLDYSRPWTEAEKAAAERVDIIGGRLMTFGIPGQNGNHIMRREDVRDKERHYMDVDMQFYNGIDTTFVFDITDQVRNRWKGGVITIELDLDTIRVPSRSGGSAFDAVVKDYEDGGTHEFEM